MITHDKLNDFETDDDSNILDDEGGIAYCDNEYCEAPAQYRVVVSEESAHDSKRDYCCSCYEVYMVGVQHGRYHEAARQNDVPGRDSSQDPPVPVSRNQKKV